MKFNGSVDANYPRREEENGYSTFTRLINLIHIFRRLAKCFHLFRRMVKSFHLFRRSVKPFHSFRMMTKPFYLFRRLVKPSLIFRSMVKPCHIVKRLIRPIHLSRRLVNYLLRWVNSFYHFRRLLTPFLIDVNDGQHDSWQVKGGHSHSLRVKEVKFILFYLLLINIGGIYISRRRER